MWEQIMFNLKRKPHLFDKCWSGFRNDIENIQQPIVGWRNAMTNTHAFAEASIVESYFLLFWRLLHSVVLSGGRGGWDWF